MKIGFLVDRPSFGGGERMLAFLMREFFKRGYQIIVYSWNQAWRNLKDNENIDYELHLLNTPPIGIKGKVRAYLDLKRELFGNTPDSLIIFSLGLAEVGVWAAKQAKVPVILSERVDPRYLPASKLHRFLKRIVFRNADGIVFQTKEVQNFFSKPIRKKGMVIANPILDDNLPIADVNNSRKEIVAVGRLSEEKNFGMLIEAFAELNLMDYKLHIYGDGPLRKELESLIGRLGVENQVVLEGHVERVVDKIQGADIFVLSSNHEGMPNVLLEAMAMGLACISTDFPSGGAKVLIKDNENGLLVPVGDKVALKEAMEFLVNHEELKMKMKRTALKIRDKNSKERIFPQWEALVMCCHKELNKNTFEVLL